MRILLALPNPSNLWQVPTPTAFINQYLHTYNFNKYYLKPPLGS
jgi:hypothetical protein